MLKSYKTPAGIQQIQVSNVNGTDWKESKVFSGLYFLDKDIDVSQVLNLYQDETLMQKTSIASKAGTHGSNTEHGLADNQYDFYPRESSFISLSDGSTNNWIQDGSTKLFYYNNSSNQSNKVSEKPVALYVSDKKMTEVSAISAIDNDDKWCWAKDPTGLYDTVWFKSNKSNENLDPDAQDAGFVKYQRSSVKQTIYCNLQTPNSKVIYMPGNTVEVIPQVSSGNCAIVTSIIIHNYRNEGLGATEVILKLKNIREEIQIYKTEIEEGETLFINDHFVLEPGDKILIYPNNKKISTIASVEIGAQN